MRDMEQLREKLASGEAGARVPGELWARCEGLLRPALLALLLLVLLCRRHGGRSEIVGVDERGGQRHERLQIGELLKAATLL